MHVVLGGSASGKSAVAEAMAMSLGEKRIYLATMMPHESEAHERIARHVRMRREKGFVSIEKYTDIDDTDFGSADVVLIECVGNLLANEMFLGSDANAKHRVLQSIWRIAERFPTVVVSNNVFTGGTEYDRETTNYIDALAVINKELCEAAQTVTEVVCGIPLVRKTE